MDKKSYNTCVLLFLIGTRLIATLQVTECTTVSIVGIGRHSADGLMLVVVVTILSFIFVVITIVYFANRR